MSYSIYAIGRDGTQTVCFADSKKKAELKVEALKQELKDGQYINKTDLVNIESFGFDTLG